MTIETISVVGLGYIGLPTAAVLADAGCRVVGVDVNQRAVDTINDGCIHIVEPGLADVVARVVADGRLRATTTPEPADAFLIAVPTPFNDDRSPNLAYVRSACEAIAPVLKAGDIVILESTSPVGATEQMAGWLAAARPDLRLPQPGGSAGDLAIAYCPERVLPGNVLTELVRNDRVIGGLTPACAERASAAYDFFVEGECILTDARTAELCKLTENAFRDVNIAFANELSLVSDQLGINVWELIRLANRHPRVNILQPGPGVGGHCIAVDPWFIVASAPDQARLIRTAREVNDGKPEWVIDQVRAAAERRADRGGPARVACLGLAFKPNIDDLRESPALAICDRLANEPGLSIVAVEPHVDALPARLAGRVDLADAQTAIAGADIVLLLVDHIVFADAHVHLAPDAVVIDTRGQWNGASRR
ncbi:UDP-N-acetyl-D-mannosamine dehydrogenase [Sphingomonas ginsenosidimutans]|jgi:UDP-N-acetyl-D-mannosaminuronic acid dehydrogenase|uniref:UDP-N-acetyl-D-mannosamine dehydrogenase n=1 Tax=Sphingomonas ginsenosidimutans TaxID=862134 RepID=A0A2A4HYJ6_9SPHN|nr:UDP-N-acetyl-D-mannosamine dehydrogenase [Sphingomonas ginsenosidimutans]PCG09111.1 UDP-N-acetyl-D-mannosamine dehydrogenase [Sphingomonas ginsenosidimutans]